MAAASFHDTLKAAVLAGLIAGATASLFHFLFTEPVIDRGIETEAELGQTRGAELKEPAVSRETQQLGLILGFLLYGVIWGLLCGVCLYLTQTIYPASWSTAQRVFALVALVGWSVALFPFLKYPANPPGVGDPETVAYRQWLYLGFIALSVLSALTALGLKRLLGRGTRISSLSALLLYSGFLILVYVAMPSIPDPVGMPPQLVWKFRALSLTGLILFWTVLAGSFGWLQRTGRSV